MKNTIDIEGTQELRNTLFFIQHNTLMCIEELDKINNGNSFGLKGSHAGNVSRLVKDIKEKTEEANTEMDTLIEYLEKNKLYQPQQF